MACSSKLGIPPGSHFLCGGAVMVERETANANTQAPSTSANPGATQYPPNDGAYGDWYDEILQPGTKVDRFGGTSNTSRFASPVGTSVEERSLLTTGAETEVQDIYEVIKPIQVKSSIIAPWNGQPGGGIQYVFPKPIKELEGMGVLFKIK